MNGDEDKVWQALKTVIDPELGVNIVDLGLVYRVKIETPNLSYDSEQTKIENIEIEMTLTTPGCPLAPYFQEQVPAVVEQGLDLQPGQVRLQFTFDPPWVQDMMSEEARAELGF